MLIRSQAPLRLAFSGDGTDVEPYLCLLYTSDAADERSSVDLGGRRIIKKQKHNRIDDIRSTHINTSQQRYDLRKQPNITQKIEHILVRN